MCQRFLLVFKWSVLYIFSWQVMIKHVQQMSITGIILLLLQWRKRNHRTRKMAFWKTPSTTAHDIWGLKGFPSSYGEIPTSVPYNTVLKGNWALKKLAVGVKIGNKIEPELCPPMVGVIHTHIHTHMHIRQAIHQALNELRIWGVRPKWEIID